MQSVCYAKRILLVCPTLLFCSFSGHGSCVCTVVCIAAFSRCASLFLSPSLPRCCVLTHCCLCCLAVWTACWLHQGVTLADLTEKKKGKFGWFTQSTETQGKCVVCQGVYVLLLSAHVHENSSSLCWKLLLLARTLLMI